jgi:hypothetical protein
LKKIRNIGNSSFAKNNEIEKMIPEDYTNSRNALKKKHSRSHGSRELRNDTAQSFALSPFDGLHNSFDPFHSSLLHSFDDSFSPFGGAMMNPFSSRSFGFDMMGHGIPFMESMGSGCQYSSGRLNIHVPSYFSYSLCPYK